MKKFAVLLSLLIAIAATGQNKYNFIQFNKLTVVEGTEYVIASMDVLGKKYETKDRILLFINTKTGLENQVNFPDGYIDEMQQVKIDSLGINLFILSGRTVDLNGEKGVNWEDPRQIIVVSADGKEKTQLTDSKLFVRTWIVNRLAGTLVITRHYDSNNNKKYDKTDVNQVQVFDLKTLKLIRTI